MRKSLSGAAAGPRARGARLCARGPEEDRGLRDRRHGRSGPEDRRRPRDAEVDEPVGRPGRRAALSPLLERLSQQPVDVLQGVRRAASWRQGGHRQGLGLHGRDLDEVGRRRAREGRPLREPGRRESRRPDGPRRPAPPPRRARRDRDARDRVEGEDPEGLRARGLRPRLLHVRPVVPEDRRLRAEGPPPPRRTPAGTATSTTRTPSSTPTGGITASRSRFPRSSSSARRARSWTRRRRTERRRSRSSRSRFTTSPSRPTRATSSKEDVFDPGEGSSRRPRSRAPRRLLGRTPEADLRAGFHKVDAPASTCSPTTCANGPRHIGTRRSGRSRGLGLWAFPYPVRPDLHRRHARGRHGRDRHGVPDDLHDVHRSRRLGRWPLEPSPPPGGGHDPRVRATATGMGLLASNEFEESWMDEGINTFTEFVMMDRKYDALPGAPARRRLHGRGREPRQAALSPDFDPHRDAGVEIRGANGSYGRNSYPQPGTTIQQIRRLLGEETFWRAFRGYAERWRFDHPTSEDFFDAMRAPGVPARLGGHRQGLATGRRLHRRFRSSRRAPTKSDGLHGLRRRRTSPLDFEETAGIRRSSTTEENRREEAQKPARGNRSSSSAATAIIDLPAEHRPHVRRTAGRRSRAWDGARRVDPLPRDSPRRRSRRPRWTRHAGPSSTATRGTTRRYTKKYEGPSAARKARVYGLHLLEILLSSLWVFL